MQDSYIKLYRKLLDSAVFHNEGLLKVWIWCLLKASYKKRIVPIKIGAGISEVEIDAGQFIFGRNKNAENLSMKSKTLYNRMQKLKKLGNLTIKSNSHYSLITVVNWQTYQDKEEQQGQAEGQAEDKRRTSGGQAEDTNKKVKEYKESNKNKNTSSGDEESTDFYFTKKKRKLSGKRLETFNRFWDVFGYKEGKAEAADSWYDIPKLTNSLVEKIIKAAKLEAIRRPDIKKHGKTPKMAQGWLSGRRWEDEVDNSDYILPENLITGKTDIGY